ncbi:MAG: hypothetical protein QW757_00805 [Candidatus Woesearchaeota archaeon]
MVYATEILNKSFEKTKELLFPIRKDYWLKMAFVSLFIGNSGFNNFGSSNLNSSDKAKISDAFKGMTFQQIISKINTSALSFLAQYGLFIGIFIFFLYLIGLLFSYFNSVFTFVFFDGIVKKEISIKKSISETKNQANSFFLFRFIFGILNFFLLLIIFSPLLIAFFNNKLAEIKIVTLIFVITAFIIYSIIIGLFLFLVNDFIVPIMFLKKYTFKQAFDYFKKISKNMKFEIFMYWLFKILLEIAGSFLSIILFLFSLLLFFVFLLFGFLLYFLLKSNITLTLIVLLIYGLISFIILFYINLILNLPIRLFFEVYKLEMVAKLEEKFEIKSEKTI